MWDLVYIYTVSGSTDCFMFQITTDEFIDVLIGMPLLFIGTHQTNSRLLQEIENTFLAFVRHISRLNHGFVNPLLFRRCLQ